MSAAQFLIVVFAVVYYLVAVGVYRGIGTGGANTSTRVFMAIFWPAAIGLVIGALGSRIDALDEHIGYDETTGEHSA